MYHNPVLLNESVESLEIKNGGIYVDLTFGGGGHSKEILKKIDTHTPPKISYNLCLTKWLYKK